MIELNDFTRQWAEIGADVIAAVERVGASGRYILGNEVARFEAELANYCGVAHAIGVASGMDALEIALRALGLREGERVVTTPFSAFATTLAILRAGAVPVFVDVDDNGNIDLDQCRTALQHHRDIRFFVPVHLYGNPLDLQKLTKLKSDFAAVTIVEDCAQAIGATFADLQVGTIGDAAAISFYPTKNLGALGDAGAILTKSDVVAERARRLRNYGQSAQYVHEESGLNSRLDELQAAILHDALLPRLSSWTKARRSTAAMYISSLPTGVRTLDVSQPANVVWHLFPTFVDRAARERFRRVLHDRQVQTSVHYPRIIPDQPAMRTVKFEMFAEPGNARTLAATEVSLPIHPFLTAEEREHVITASEREPVVVESLK